jgi:hypothetical protein
MDLMNDNIALLSQLIETQFSQISLEQLITIIPPTILNKQDKCLCDKLNEYYSGNVQQDYMQQLLKLTYGLKYYSIPNYCSNNFGYTVCFLCEKYGSNAIKKWMDNKSVIPVSTIISIQEYIGIPKIFKIMISGNIDDGWELDTNSFTRKCVCEKTILVPVLNKINNKTKFVRLSEIIILNELNWLQIKRNFEHYIGISLNYDNKMVKAANSDIDIDINIFELSKPNPEICDCWCWGDYYALNSISDNNKLPFPELKHNILCM